jgi:hypothetical protein
MFAGEAKIIKETLFERFDVWDDDVIIVSPFNWF